MPRKFGRNKKRKIRPVEPIEEEVSEDEIPDEDD
jgi:hypothetical protein